MKRSIFFVLAWMFLDHTAVFSAEMNLKEMISEALKNNPEIQAAARKVEAARARAGQAGYLEDPELNVEAWGIPLNRPLSFRSANPIILGVRQKIPFFGKRGLQSDMAGQEVKMAEEELKAKEIDIAAKVRSAYADVYMAFRTIDINQELLELNRLLSTTVENLYRVGKAPQQDIFKALLEQTDLLNKLASAEKDRITTQAKLNTLLNRSITEPVGQPAEPVLTPLALQYGDLEKFATEQRPELRALKASIGKSEKAIELAERNGKYPDFMVGLQYWVAPDQETKHMYTPMLSLTIPFSPWTRGKHDYEVQEALAEKQMAQSNLSAMKNLALLEVRENLAKVEASGKSVSIYRDGLLPQADQSFQSTVAAYQAGTVNFMTLLDAQRTIRDLRMGYYKTLVEYEHSMADLERAVGKKLSQ
jgi:cobalt-zinc-cadmium efflux system outer membrane protein